MAARKIAGANQVSKAGVPVAIGENALSLTNFLRLIDTRAVDYIQPSVKEDRRHFCHAQHLLGGQQGESRRRSRIRLS